MDEKNDAKAEAIRKAYAEAREMKEEGVPPDMIEDTIKKKLIESGLEPAAAVMICGNLPGVRPEPKDNSAKGKKNMLVGAGLLIFGIAVSWLSELMAIQKGGGYYIIALGPIFAGIGMLVKGAFDYKS